jgi:hypothetical protein
MPRDMLRRRHGLTVAEAFRAVQRWFDRPNPDRLRADRAAIAAVRAHGLPLPDTDLVAVATAAGLGRRRISDARLVIRNAPDLLPAVDSGRVALADAAVVASQVFRGYADFGAAAERALTLPARYPYRRQQALRQVARASRERQLRPFG